MTNEWPLSFFYIKDNSVIYLENIETEVTSILKKQMSSKSKYFKSLGLLPTLGTIIESKNEDKESILKSRRESKRMGLDKGERGESFSSNELMEILIQVIINII